MIFTMKLEGRVKVLAKIHIVALSYLACTRAISDHYTMYTNSAAGTLCTYGTGNCQYTYWASIYNHILYKIIIACPSICYRRSMDMISPRDIRDRLSSH